MADLIPQDIPFGEWAPDQPDYKNPGSSNIRNVIPLTEGSYGPMKALQPFSGALASACIGGQFVRDNAGNVSGFAATTTRIYRLTSASTNWSDVTQVASPGTAITAITKANPGQVTSAAHGLVNGDSVYISGVVGMTQVNNLFFTVTRIDANNFTIGVDTSSYTAYSSAGTAQKELFYSVAAGETWQFTVSDQRVIACNINGNIQTLLMGTDTQFKDLSATAPKARYCAMVRDFLMVANTTDASNGARPQRVWWSAIADPTNWPTIGSATAIQVQSDSQDLLGEGGWIQGLAGGLVNADVGIFQERRLWRGQYVGSQGGIFSFQMVDAGRGCAAPGSIVQAGGVAFFLSDSGFCAFDGANVVPIGDQKIDHFFYSDVDKGNLSRITSACAPEDQLVYWAYPGQGSSGGTPNRLLVYHYMRQRFTLIDSINTEYLLKGLTFGYTLDQLNPFGTLETLPFSLDSRAWTGGRLALGAFDTNHKFGYFQGPAIACTMDTTETALNEDGMAYVNRVWPLVDATAAQVQVGYRNRLADSVQWTPAASISGTTGSASVRATGMYHRARVTIPASAVWSQGQGVKADARSAGRR